MVEILPYHVVWATESLKKDMEQRCDCYGDSWDKPVDEQGLRHLLDNMIDDDLLSENVENIISSCPELREIDYGGLFRSWRVVVEDLGVWIVGNIQRNGFTHLYVN